MGARVLIAAAEDYGPLAEVLRAAGHALEVCPPARLGAALESFAPDACLLALGGTHLPREVAELLQRADRPALVALLDASCEALAAELLERGADALAPRTASPSWIAATLPSVLGRRAHRAELGRLRAQQLEADELVLCGASQAARRLRDALDRVASTPRTTVLISGERAAGLEPVARLVHARSARAEGPLAELRAGAADDIAQARDFARSLLPQALGGTLIVHEVGSAGVELQHSLAAALERGEADATAPDVRLVATSSSDLAGEVQAGRFGADLLYKLNVLALAVPPFSARRADLAEIAKRAAQRAKRRGRTAAALDREALAAIALRPWPGGLDELIAAVELGCVRTPGGAEMALPGPGWIALEQAPALPASGTAATSSVRSLRSAEESLIRQVLAETGGNKLRSAEILGIHRTTLYSKLREYGIEA